MIMPNFLIIGAAKSGTTSLHKYLNQHSQIYMSPDEEMHFFAYEQQELDWQGIGDISLKKRVIHKLEDYQSHFDSVLNEVAIGEKSAFYLYEPKAPERIQYYLPNVKLITVLRNPVERAYSSFLHLVRDGREPLNSFAQALAREEERIRNNWEPLWHYQKGGFYNDQLKRYFNRFDPDQIKVCLYEDYQNNPQEFMQDIFKFLEVKTQFTPDTSKKFNVGQNQATVPKNKVWHEFLSQPNVIKSLTKQLFPQATRTWIRETLKQKNLGQPPLTADVRKYLIESYRQDIMDLQVLIQRDLSDWLEE